MRSSSIKKILILATILAVPGFLYYLLQAGGKNRYRNLPYFGPKEVAKTWHTKRGKKIFDTTYHKVKHLGLVNETGNRTNLDTISNKVFIVSLFYIKGGYSATITQNAMKKLYDGYNKNPHIQFLSVTVDPEHDSPSALGEYKNALKLKPGNWHFLTGTAEEIKHAVHDGLLLDVISKDGKITYNNLLVLLDYKHQIRGYYDPANEEATAKLDDEIKVLLAEELRNIKDGR